MASDYLLGVYEKALPPDLTLKEKASFALQSGFDHMEISIDESDEKLARLYDDTKTRLQKTLCDHSLKVRTMCLSGHRRFPMGSHDADVRKKSMDIMKRAIEFSDTVGIRIIQLAGYDVYYEPSDDLTKKYFLENLTQATEFAAKYGVTLGFETMETPFMDTIQKAMVYVHKIKSPYLTVYPDIGNLTNACVKYNLDIKDEFSSGKGHISAAHLKETIPDVYRNMDFGTGHVDYLTCIRALWQQGVRLFTGEFWYQKESDEKKVALSNRFLREQIERIKA